MLSALIGTGATLLYFGMETFALPLLATRLSGDALTEAAEQLRMSGPQVTVFGVGLILVAVAAIMFAVRLHRAGTVSTAAAIVFAAGWATILPQFFGGQPVRLAHGLLMVAGGLWLAADLHRSPGVTAGPNRHGSVRSRFPSVIVGAPGYAARAVVRRLFRARDLPGRRPPFEPS